MNLRSGFALRRQVWGCAVLVVMGMAAVGRGAGGGVGITKLLTFAGADRVRIETTVKVEQAGEVRLGGRIVSAEDGGVLWEGEVGAVRVGANETATVVKKVEGLRPVLWSPTRPALYFLEVRASRGGEEVGIGKVRFGFRSFEVRADGRFYLNGRPIYLRGLAINPPGRTIPKSLDEDRRFAEDYVRYLQSIDVNMIRMSDHSQVWFDVCDELGMMVFQGRYGGAPGASASRPPSDFAKSLALFKEDVFEPLTNHPSVVIYVLANEQSEEDVPWHRTNWQAFRAYYQKLHQAIRAWDEGGHPIIGNAGYGMGRSGDICDIHRYWGWYYGSFGNYFTLLDAGNFLRVEGLQPITMSECVGNYTGVDGRFNLCARTKQPGSSLHWTGFAPQREQSFRALAYQAWMIKQATEYNRRFRSVNGLLSGTMPFTILFHHWHDIDEFADMDPKPAAQQLDDSYNPVLLSWEFWRPNVYAGSTIRPIAHVVNDHDAFADLEDVVLKYELASVTGNRIAEGRIRVGAVAYYGTKETEVAIGIPAWASTGEYVLRGRLLEQGVVVAENRVEMFVADRVWALSHPEVRGEIALYDTRGETAKGLDGLGIAYRRIRSVEGVRAGNVIVIGERSWDGAIGSEAGKLAKFVEDGGRVVVLGQEAGAFDTSWLGVGVTLCEGVNVLESGFMTERPFANGMAINPQVPESPVFSGIERDRLFLWSDATGWRQREGKGFPRVYPVMYGYTLDAQDGYKDVRVLASHEHGLVGVALAEIFKGRGTVLLSGFEFSGRAGLDPVADRMLGNLVAYAADGEEHEAYELVTEPIVWGDYESEKGLLTGIHSGLILNTTPLIPEELREAYPFRVDMRHGAQYAGSGGGWNSRPSIQFVPNGRRPYGPYDFTPGGNSRPDESSELGTGVFRCRVPAGRRSMVTTVWNPAGQEGVLEVAVNEHAVTKKTSVAAGQTVEIRTALPGVEELAVRYTGNRYLVLLETAFE